VGRRRDAIGRIGLALGEELAVPEVAGVLSVHRADLVAAPTGFPEGPLVQLDPKLFNRPYPAGTPFAPFAAAHLGQFWLVSSGWRQDPQRQAAAVYGPEPVIATPPQVPAAGQDSVTGVAYGAMEGDLDQPAAAHRRPAAVGDDSARPRHERARLQALAGARGMGADVVNQPAR